ncbi:hypothetical protein FHS21_006222 [Phyllobacterium trifolii]|uniref:Putative endonuclease Z1 domain-containing protein n=1 Tax=Phyllobacterium trifolii TaxID=300193 RepID=A0A839UF51_9HYPH|nr:Z1 domain-containing protein [Phyllobacterium trifolii]MBB3149768.1 hypothetical protein [Phyllobacterium trifolii]
MSAASVIKVVQELLSNEDRASISAALINKKVDLAFLLDPSWKTSVDRDAVVTELIRRSSQWIGESSTLKNEAGHVGWLNATRKSHWRYWQRYREFMERKASLDSVDELDKVTDEILGLIEDPVREGSWDRRGLVVGHVQSGKTGNYTGLICKAADAGYKIIVVLAGIHNNLRAQTQMRLDEGFLGYETHPDPDAIKTIGVGTLDADPSIRPNYVTNRSNNGDFNSAIAKNLGITPEKRPWLLVVKKNKTVLEKLNKWIRNHVADSEDATTGRKTVTRLPLLLIDDEADNASVDTGEDAIDENGKPDLEYSPKVINGLIRTLLHSFSKSAYVGYTATPFANIFIHERGETQKEGPDLFPASFIINLGTPNTYVGPSKIFGRRTADGREKGLPVFRAVKDFASHDGLSGWMPQKHKSTHRPLYEQTDELPPSLKEAVDAFVLACAARHLRGQGESHCSMLVHVTRFNNVQNFVFEQVEAYVRYQKQRILRGVDAEQVLARLQSLWVSDFMQTTATTRTQEGNMDVPISSAWVDVLNCLPNIVADIEVRKINGTAKDALDYADAGKGLKVIAIGGDKLSRGLTLEGLCVSYFLRASKMYDTLMQMGRWFGYRPGYVDLCRLYSTEELADWFGHIADASEELREEFELMAASGSTPRDFGLKVQSHSVMLVTSKLKMRTARSLMLSFSGQVVETVSMRCDKEALASNYDAALSLFAALGNAYHNPIVRERAGASAKWNGCIWEQSRPQHVIDFLTSYKTHADAHKVNSQLLAQFIDMMNRSNELDEWTVAVLGGSGAAFNPIPGVNMVIRQTDNPDRNDRYSIGRLLSPRDESIALSSFEWDDALKLAQGAWRNDPAKQIKQKEEPKEPNGPSIRRIAGLQASGRRRGLLLIYPMDPQKTNHRLLMAQPHPVIGFGMSFPDSQSGIKVEYKINNVLWELEYGSSE